MNGKELAGRRIESSARWRAQMRAGMGLSAALACLISGTACKRNGVTAVVDVASLIPPEDLTGSYAAPPGSPTVDVDLEPISVNLEEAVQSLANAEEMTLDVAVRFDNTSGQGAGSVAVFFGPSPESAYDDAPAATLEAALAPGQTSTASSRIRVDSRVLALFKTGQAWMGLRLHWAPASADPLAGQYTITKIRARVVSHLGFV